jgi:hypothetical protein
MICLRFAVATLCEMGAAKPREIALNLPMAIWWPTINLKADVHI